MSGNEFWETRDTQGFEDGKDEDAPANAQRGREATPCADQGSICVVKASTASIVDNEGLDAVDAVTRGGAEVATLAAKGCVQLSCGVHRR